MKCLGIKNQLQVVPTERFEPNIPALGLFFPLELLADVEFEVVDELVDNLALELVEACEFGM